MISSSKNRVQELKGKFENLSIDISSKTDSQLNRQKNIFTSNLGKENAESKILYDLPSADKDNGIESESSDEWSPKSKPNSSYLYARSPLSHTASLPKNILTRQISDPGKKLHRSHAFRCDKSKKINTPSPKRHSSCYARSESSDFSLKMESRLCKDRLKRLGSCLEEHMRKENFVHKALYARIINPDDNNCTAVPEESKMVSDKSIVMESVPDSEVPQHIMQQYAQVSKTKKKYADKQEVMTDSGVSSETENVDDDKVGRINRLRSQFEKFSEKTNLDAMNGFSDSNETLRLERKNPHLILTDTLKKALKQPLPMGPPPKKPPRVLKSDVPSETEKKEALRKLEKLESFLQKKTEPVTEKTNKIETPNKSKEIHYLCTEILDITNRTLLPNSTSDPVTHCLNSFNCAITSNSTTSLPYTHIKDMNRLSKRSSCSNDNLDTYTKQIIYNHRAVNDENQNEFKCYSECKVRNSKFYVPPHIYDVPNAEDFRFVRKNKYGVLSVMKTSKSMLDLSLNNNEDQEIYTEPYEPRSISPVIPHSTSEPSQSPNNNDTKTDFQKLRLSFENGFPEAEVKKTVVSPKPILVSKKLKELKNMSLPTRRIKPDGNISFVLPKRDTQLDLDKENLKCLMNELFETVTAVCNMDNNKIASFPTDYSDSSTSEESVKLTRSLTDKRKNYVRRVSTRVAYLDPKNIKRLRNQTSVCSYKSDILDNNYSTFRSWKSFRNSQSNFAKMDSDSKFNLTDSKGNLLSMKDMLDGSRDSFGNLSIDEKTGCIDLPFEPREKGLFNICLLVGLNYMTGQAYVKSVFPSQVQVPLHIENLVFPETMSDAPKGEWVVDAKSLQCYSLVLTDERGERAYGYCRRVLPEGATTCLPLCYCLIGMYRAPGFYYKVLEEIESRHGRSDSEIHSLLQQLYDNDFPNPGEEITISYTSGMDFHKEDYKGRSRTLSDITEMEKYRDLENNNAVNLCLEQNKIKIIKRPIEPRVDEDNLSTVLDVLGAGLLIKVFASLLLERKVIIMGHHMRLVSSCIEALQSALYPFVWQQPLISSIPNEIQREVLEAPLPILAGMLHTGADADFTDVVFDEGMLLDLSQPSKVLFYQGDESTILPSSCYKTLKTYLQMETSKNRDLQDKTRNVMISEAFLRFFVDILGDFWQFFSVREMKEGDLGKGNVVFDREAFLKNAPSKQIQYFLEWFTETAMFTHFIQNMASTYHHRLNNKLPPPQLVDTPLPDFYELFNDRITVRHYKLTNKNIDNTKNNYKSAVNKKVKFLKSKLRELVA